MVFFSGFFLVLFCGTNILMTCIGEYHNRQSAQRIYCAGPFDDTNITRRGMRIDGEMIHHKHNQISDRHERDKTGVFERVKPSQEAEGNDEKHECRNPKVSVDQVRNPLRLVVESQHDAGHEIADDDHVGNGHAKALDGNGSVKDDGCLGIRDLRQGKEGCGSAVEVAGAFGLEV